MSQFMLPTQPMTDSIENCTPPQEFEQAWGRFYPLSINIPRYINLCMDEFTIGRGPNCNYTLTVDEIGERFYNCVSNVHFKIKRAEPENGVFVALITDLSSNGTYVNGKCIGRNQSLVLSNHDNIGIAAATCNVFLYHDLNVSSYCEHPSEIADHYAIFNVLGKGGYGEVRLVFKKDTTERFAMKTIDVQPIEDKKVIDVFNEVKILRTMNHPNVVRMSYMTLVNNHIYLLLEYMHGGDLGRYILKRTRLSEDVTKHIFFQVLKGVNYLHDNKVIHRDIKPANILLSSETDRPFVKISDFGLSKFIEGPAVVRTRCGTMSYAPPELQFGGTYDFTSDVWSLGVLLYYCISGVLPFRRDRGDMPMELQIKRASFTYAGDVWMALVPPRRPVDIIRKCLRADPRTRCHVKELIFDDWFRKDDLYRKSLLAVQNKENAARSLPSKKRCV